jgi:beta-lactamase class C
VPHCLSVRNQSTREINLATPTRTVIQSLSHVDEWVGPHGVPGVGAVVWSGGEIVAERYAGEARPGVPVTSETLFPLASVTKPISAATFIALVDDGEISLDEPVGRLLLEFRAGPAAGADGVDTALERLRPTIGARQLLCHVSGLPEDLGPRESSYQDGATIETVIDQMCRLPLQSGPGKQLRYSNAGYGVIARLTEHISGQPFWHSARSRIFEPLGIREIVADPTGVALERVAHLTDTNHPGTDIETYNSAYWRSLALPWGGLFGTPRDAVRFAAAFLPSGYRFLSEAATSLMTSDQTMGVPGGVESAKVRWDPGRWGLGWEVKGEKRLHWTGDFTSPRTFCHFGHAGTLLWGDPERDIALAVFANRTVTHMWGFILPRWARLSNAVIAAVIEPATG